MLQNKKKLIIVLAVVMVLSTSIGFRIYQNIADSRAQAGKMAQIKNISVQVGQVVRQDITPRVVFSGSLEPIWQAEVSAKVDGRIYTLSVNEGDRVKAGEVIAVLDTDELRAQVVQARGNLTAQLSNLEQAQMDYNRYSALAKQGAVSEQMLDNARTKRDLAAGQVTAAEGSLALVQEKLNNAKVAVPRDGVVTKRHVQAGAFTRAGSPLVTVADLSTLLAKATVGEAQVADLIAGSTVQIVLDALRGQEFSGVITRISPVAALPARTFTAEISIPNHEGILKAGMFAKVQLETQPHKGAIVVPENALVMREDQKTVYVVLPDNRVQQRLLTLGYVGDGLAEVLDGLAEGDTIVTGGQNKVKDGTMVVPVSGGGL